MTEVQLDPDHELSISYQKNRRGLTLFLKIRSGGVWRHVSREIPIGRLVLDGQIEPAEIAGSVLSEALDKEVPRKWFNLLPSSDRATRSTGASEPSKCAGILPGARHTRGSEDTERHDLPAIRNGAKDLHPDI